MSEAETDRIAESVAHLADMVERMEAARPGGISANGNVVRLEGAGSIWNGLAIGVALGAVIAGSVALMSRLQQMDLRVQQAEAFQAALYMTSPSLAKAIEEDLNKREERKKRMIQEENNQPSNR